MTVNALYEVRLASAAQRPLLEQWMYAESQSQTHRVNLARRWLIQQARHVVAHVPQNGHESLQE